MYKRLMIICEGQTEQTFCKALLIPYFQSLGIALQPCLLKSTGGGMTKWPRVKTQIQNHLREGDDVYVTTFFDFYRLPSDFPGFRVTSGVNETYRIIEQMELAMSSDMGCSRFIPYLQMHEFEALLFDSIDIFDTVITHSEWKNRQSLVETLNTHENPEHINHRPATAPSMILDKAIIGYKGGKPLFGKSLSETIGLERIRAKNPRFNHWIETLESI